MKLPHACLICALPFGVKSGLCSYCGPRLFQLREPITREPATRFDQRLPVHSLFAWRRQEWPALATLVHALKGKDDPEPWRELAAWFVHERFADAEAGRVALVPVPSSAANHALGWARALAECTGFVVEDILHKIDKGENKGRTRGERGKLRFGRHGDLCTKYRAVVIVDDIVTTGATARAAYRALGRPRNCEVWCLMDRRPWQDDAALL